MSVEITALDHYICQRFEETPKHFKNKQTKKPKRGNKLAQGNLLVLLNLPLNFMEGSEHFTLKK